jgi:hypothetical protein
VVIELVPRAPLNEEVEPVGNAFKEEFVGGGEGICMLAA